MGDLGKDTMVSGADGNYRARLSPEWNVWGPNGGYVAAVALRAAAAQTDMTRPATFSCHFLSVAEFAEVDLQVVSLRRTKRAESLRVSMSQNGRPVVDAMVWAVADVDGLEHDAADMPQVPAPDSLKPIEELLPPEEREPRYAFWKNLESRPLNFVHWTQRPIGPPLWREWYRFRPRAVFDDPFVDACRLLILLDTMGWPAATRAHPIDAPWIAPSLDLTAQFHRNPSKHEWLLADAVAPIATEGLIGSQARVWSPDGQLLATGSGQLLCRPAPVAK